MPERLPVISLFSGAGGLDFAVEKCAEPPLVQDGTEGPLEVVVATDYDHDAVESFEANHDAPVLEGDIRKVPTQDLLDAAGIGVGDAALVVGGPPCTPFSKSGFWLEEKRESRDPNASLLDEFVRVVDEARPEAFVLENVQGLTYRTHEAQFDRLLGQLDDLGYRPQWEVLNAAEYGVPQLRKRVFVIGSRDGLPLRFPENTHAGWSEHSRDFDTSKLPFVTSREAIGDLLPGEAEPDELVDGGQYDELAAAVPPGENYLWHSERGGGENAFEWRSRYWTFLLKLDPERPSTTLQAQPGPYVGPFHWENLPNGDGEMRARRLRVPEMLRLMTFPDDFVLLPHHSRSTVQKLLGNAVPVELGKVVIRAVLEQLGHLDPELDLARLEAEQLELV